MFQGAGPTLHCGLCNLRGNTHSGPVTQDKEFENRGGLIPLLPGRTKKGLVEYQGESQIDQSPGGWPALGTEVRRNGGKCPAEVSPSSPENPGDQLLGRPKMLGCCKDPPAQSCFFLFTFGGFSGKPTLISQKVKV